MQITKLSVVEILIILISTTIAVFIIYIVINKNTIYEPFGNKQHPCPDILIKKGNDIYLFNSKLAEIPGINPIKFNNLEEYVEFVNWQRSQNVNCPVLFLQQSYDVQGKLMYKIRPSPTDLKGGLNSVAPIDLMRHKSDILDASKDNSSYNQTTIQGYDPDNQYIGLNTSLDKEFYNHKKGISPNPIDPNWGGHEYTKSLIDKGYYDKYKRMPSQF